MAIAAGNPLLNPNAPLSGPALLQAAKALANAQTQPAIQQIAQEIAQNNRQTTGAENLTGQYFTQLGNQAQSGLSQAQGIQSGLNSQLQGLTGQEDSQLQGIGNNALSSFQSHTPGGAGAAGQSALAAEIARQQGLAAQNEGAMRGFGATQGANYSGLAASNLGTFGLKGQEDLNQIAQAGQTKNEPLTQKMAQENSVYGATLASDLGKLRQQEITNQQADAGLGIKQQAAQTTAANDAATQKINQGKLGVAQQNANTSITKANNAAKNQNFQNNPSAVGSAAWQRVQSSEGKAWSDDPNAVGSPAWTRTRASGGAGGGRPLSPNENNTWYGKLDSVEQLVQQGNQPITSTEATNLKDALGWNVSAGQKLSEQQVRTLLANGLNPTKTQYSAVMIQAAYELNGWGHLTPQTAAAMRQMGLRGGTFRGAPIKVAPAPAPAGGLPLPGGLAGAVPGIGNTISNSVPTIS